LGSLAIGGGRKKGDVKKRKRELGVANDGGGEWEGKKIPPETGKKPSSPIKKKAKKKKKKRRGRIPPPPLSPLKRERKRKKRATDLGKKNTDHVQEPHFFLCCWCCRKEEKGKEKKSGEKKEKGKGKRRHAMGNPVYFLSLHNLTEKKEGTTELKKGRKKRLVAPKQFRLRKEKKKRKKGNQKSDFYAEFKNPHPRKKRGKGGGGGGRKEEGGEGMGSPYAFKSFGKRGKEKKFGRESLNLAGSYETKKKRGEGEMGLRERGFLVPSSGKGGKGGRKT